MSTPTQLEDGYRVTEVRDPLAVGARFLLGCAVFFVSWRVFRLPALNITLADGFFFVTLFLLLLRGRINVAPLAQLTPFYFIGLLLMLGGLLLGTIVNGNATRWAIASMQYLFAYAGVAIIFACFDRPWLARMRIVFAIAVALSQLVGLLSMYTPLGGVLQSIFGPGFLTGNGRMGAMTGEPNPNGAMCVFAWIFLLHGIQVRQVNWKLALPLAGMLAFGLLNSASFTAFSACAITTTIMLAASGFKSLVKLGLPIVLLATGYLAAGFPLPQIFQERVAGAIQEGNPNEAGTFVGRSELIAEAWEMADDHILVGLGADQYRQVSIYGAPVHNLPMLMLVEGGVVGFIGLVLMFAVMAASSMITYTRNRLDGAMCISSVLHFGIFMMAIPHMYASFWAAPILLAVISCVPRLSEAYTAALRGRTFPTHLPA